MNADGLRLNDFVVVTATDNGSGLTALSLKRTEQGVNDRKFDGTDELPYNWGFPLGKRNPSDPNENLLFAGQLLSVDVANERLQLSNAVIQIKTHPDNLTLVWNNAGNEMAADKLAPKLESLLQTDPTRVIWINLQGDNRTSQGKVFADKITFKLDWQGKVITGQMLPE